MAFSLIFEQAHTEDDGAPSTLISLYWFAFLWRGENGKIKHSLDPFSAHTHTPTTVRSCGSEWISSILSAPSARVVRCNGAHGMKFSVIVVEGVGREIST
jgi:hypothetical protein